MHEREFIERLQASQDDELRAVYADWLAGVPSDPRAPYREALLRSQLGAAAPSADTLARLHNHDAAWVACVDRGPIARCPGSDLGSPDYDFRCPSRWEDLAATEEDALVRYCGTCNERVHFCTTNDEAVALAMTRPGLAIAIASTERERFGSPARVRPGHGPDPPEGALVGLGLTSSRDGWDIWHRGLVDGLPIAVSFSRVCPTERAPRLRVVVPFDRDLAVDLIPQPSVPDDPGFPFVGEGRHRLDLAARGALARFGRIVGSVSLRRRGRIRLPEFVLANAPQVLVHWAAVPTDNRELVEDIRNRTTVLGRLARALSGR